MKRWKRRGGRWERRKFEKWKRKEKIDAYKIGDGRLGGGRWERVPLSTPLYIFTCGINSINVNPWANTVKLLNDHFNY